MDRTRSGFTLIEVSIAIFVIGIVSTGFFTTFNICLRSWDVYTERFDKLTSVNLFFSNLSKDIRESLEIIEAGTSYIVYRGRDDRVYNYNLRDNIIYKTSEDGMETPLVEDVSGFNVSSSYDNSFFLFSITQTIRDTSLLYRTGVARRIS